MGPLTVLQLLLPWPDTRQWQTSAHQTDLTSCPAWAVFAIRGLSAVSASNSDTLVAGARLTRRRRLPGARPNRRGRTLSRFPRCLARMVLAGRRSGAERA